MPFVQLQNRRRDILHSVSGMGCGASSSRTSKYKADEKAHGASFSEQAPSAVGLLEKGAWQHPSVDPEDQRRPKVLPTLDLDLAAAGAEPLKIEEAELRDPKPTAVPLPRLNLKETDLPASAAASVSLAKGKYFAPRPDDSAATGKAKQEQRIPEESEGLGPQDLSDIQDEARREGGSRAHLQLEEIYRRVGPRDGERGIGKAEFLQIMKRVCPAGYESDGEIERLFDEIDLDGSGDLDYEEFEDWTLHDLEGQEVLTAIREKLKLAKERRLSALRTQELQVFGPPQAVTDQGALPADEGSKLHTPAV